MTSPVATQAPVPAPPIRGVRRMLMVGRPLLAAGGARLVALPLAGVLALVNARVVIAATGSEGYGFVSLVASLFAILPFGDLGLGAAVVNIVAGSPDPRDDPRVRTFVAATAQLLATLAAGLVVIDVILMLTGSWASILGAPRSSGINDAAGWALVILGLGMPFGLGQRVLLGLHRAGEATIVQLVGSVTTTTVTVAAWQLHGGLAIFAAAPAIGSFVTSLGQCLVMRRLGGPSLGDILVKALDGRLAWAGLSSSAVPMLIVTLGLPLALQTDRVVLAHRSGQAALPAYSLGLQFYAPLWGLVASAGLALWPIFVRRRTASAAAAARALRVSGASFAVAGIVVAAILVGAGSVLDGPVSGHRIALSPGLLAAFGALLVVQSLQLPLGMYFTDTTGLRFQAVCVVALVPTSLVLSILLAPRYGGVGVLVGSSIAVFACQFVPALSRSRRNRSERG